MKKNKFFSSIHRLHLIPKLVCVMFAFIFWIYVMEVDSPDYEDVFEDVAVTVAALLEVPVAPEWEGKCVPFSDK